MASRDKVGILEAVTDFLETDEANAVGKLVLIREVHNKNQNTILQLEEKISKLESHECPANSGILQDDSARVAKLEAQLRAAKDANVNLQRIVASSSSRLGRY